MKLYTFDVAPNPRRLLLFLKHKGIHIETETIDLMKGEQFAEDFRAINPACTVPALVLDDGTVLTEVIAICLYLDKLHPQKPLFGSSDLEHAQVVGWTHRIFLEGLLAVAEMLRNQGDTFKDRALPGTVQMPQIPALVERGKIRLQAFFNTMNQHLDGRNYMVGDSLTQADIDALVACDFAGWVQETIPESCTHLRDWHQRIDKIFAPAQA